jgi:hypothetical protein
MINVKIIKKEKLKKNKINLCYINFLLMKAKIIEEKNNF